MIVNFNPQLWGESRLDVGLLSSLSPGAYNERVGLAIVCPITNQVKGYPFEVSIPPGLDVTGVVLADHIRSVDWRVRNTRVIRRLPQSTVEDTLRKLDTLIGLTPVE